MFYSSNRSNGWRYGLQIMAGVILITSIGSLFYRSATLYHPQRRAILHLKSQRRKVLEIGPGGSGTDDVRKLKCYKNCSLHATFASAFIASFGISLPVVHLVRCNYLYTIYVSLEFIAVLLLWQYFYSIDSTCI